MEDHTKGQILHALSTVQLEASEEDSWVFHIRWWHGHRIDGYRYLQANIVNTESWYSKRKSTVIKDSTSGFSQPNASRNEFVHAQ